MKYDRAIYIGRFQPFHVGHRSAINRALELANEVIILVGSANSPRTPKNPFTYNERRQMIRDEFQGENITIRPLRDFKYDDTRWIQEVQEQASASDFTHGLEASLHGIKTCLVGLDKDASTYYLHSFPHWKFEQHERDPMVSATAIRRILLRGESLKLVKGAVPASTFLFLADYVQTDEYKNTTDEAKFVQDYRAKYSHLEFPPTFVTTDAVVVQSGHVLLIKRGQHPGKGLWALPGGFLAEKETLFDTAIRELYEETGIKVQEKIIRDRCLHSQVFDSPERDTRGRTLTHAYLFRLDDDKPLPKVKGADDAAEALWVPLSEFEKLEPEMYSDHWHIIKSLI